MYTPQYQNYYCNPCNTGIYKIFHGITRLSGFGFRIWIISKGTKLEGARAFSYTYERNFFCPAPKHCEVTLVNTLETQEYCDVIKVLL